MPKRQSYTVSFKLQALQYLDNEAGGNVSECAREFSVDRKRIREWSENRDRLEQQYGKNKQKRKLSKGPAVRSEHVDQGVLRYLEDERSEGRVVRNKDLKRKAMELAGAFNVVGFSASDMWLSRWKQRHFVSCRQGTSSSQKVPADFEDQLLEFRRNVLRIRHRHGYPLSNIMNMDQTMVRFDMMPARTNKKKCAKQVRIKSTKAEKRGFTVALTAAADGTKLPAFVILRERNGNIPPRVFLQLRVTDNVCVCATANGWMTRDTVNAWIQRVLWPSDERRLLLLDCYSAHRTEAVRDALQAQQVDRVIIPAGLTPLAQPVDVALAKPFKDSIRDCWVEWMREPRPPTAAGNLRQTTRQDVNNWDNIRPETIVTSFLRCALSNAMDGSQDDEVLEWFPDEIGAVLPRVDGNAPGPEEPKSEDDSPDDSDADADFEGLE
ncbi:hypothetical protein ACOMHN_063117 [Nucella lapillus]